MNKSQVSVAERKSYARILELQHNPVKGKFDTAHLREIHRRILQDSPGHGPGDIRPKTDSWQKNRSLEVTALSYPVYYDSGNLHGKMDKVLKSHGGVQGFKGLSISKFSEKMADLYGAADYIHPFQEGNSRTLRTFTEQLAQEAGFKLDWDASGANAAKRDALYKARDREVTLRKFPGLNEARAMKTNDRREYAAYMFTLVPIKDGPSLKENIQANVERIKSPKQAISIDVPIKDAKGLLDEHGIAAREEFEQSLSISVKKKT